MATRIPAARRNRAAKRLEPRKTAVQRRSRATVEALLEAAARVFEERGYAAGTTNRIAERAGVSVGTLYQYFPNKEALAVALLERHLELAMRRLDGWIARSLSEPRGLRAALELFVAGMIELHAEQPRLQHVLLEETPRPPRVHDALLRFEADGAQRVAGLLRTFPEVRHPDLDAAAVLAVHAAEGLTHRFAAHPGAWLPAEAFARELADLLEVYLVCERPKRRRAGRGRA